MLSFIRSVSTAAIICVALGGGKATVLSWAVDRIFSYVANSSLLTCDFSKAMDLNVTLLRIYRYDYDTNTTVGYSLDTAAEILRDDTSFNQSHMMVFFIPGFGNILESDGPVNIINGYRNISNTYVFILDASNYTNNRGGLFELYSYEGAVRYTSYIGRQFAKFLKQLNKSLGVSLENIHVIGHSLGAQCAGYIGKYFQNSTGNKLKRVTGLDPAGPCFNKAGVEDTLDKTDAEFVDIYHCNIGQYGTNQFRGTADFFPNGDYYIQPKCEVNTLDIVAIYNAASCSHELCPAYWAESVAVEDSFIGRQCSSWSNFKNGTCSSNSMTIAGYGTPSNVTQYYYYITKSTSPYGLGIEGASP